MNLRLFSQVVSRFRVLVALGFCLAVAVAVVSYAHVTFAGGKPHFVYRSAERWQSTATLLVTQQGFPWGRSVLDQVVPVGPSGKAGYAPKFGDGDRLTGLASLYAQLAKADQVRAIMLRQGPIRGEYDASGVTSQVGTGLPLMAIAGFGPSQADARTTADRATSAFLTYLRRLQQQNRIPAGSRVTVQLVERPTLPTLIQGRRKTKPIFFFVIVLSATIGLVFLLENLRPRASAVPVERDKVNSSSVGPSTTPVPGSTQKTA